MRSTRRTHRSLFAALVTVVAVTACTPAPPMPVWTPTIEAWNATSGHEVERPLASTSNQWFAVVEESPTIGVGATSTNLLVYPRTGADGAPAATPSQTIPLEDNVANISMSDHIIAIRSRDYLANLDTVHLYGLDPTTHLWSESLALPRGLDTNAIVVIDVTDTALALGNIPSPMATGDGSVLVYPLTVSPTTGAISGSSVTAAALSPDPTWSASDRQGFGRVVSIEGDWLAVSGGTDHVAAYHRTAPTTWAPDLVMTNPLAPGSDGRFGRSLSIDASAVTPRLLVGTQGGFSTFGGSPTAGRVELLTRGPSGGWSLSQTISPRAGSALGGFALGIEVALDHDRAVVGYYWAQVAGAGGVTLMDDYRLEVWNLTPAPVFEAELSMLAPHGGPLAGETATAPVGVRLAGSHLSVVSWDIFGSNPSHFSALSWDRHPSS